MTEITLEQKARARQAAQELKLMGHSLAMELEPAGVRHMWQCVMWYAARRIGVDKVIRSAVIVDGGERPSFAITDDDFD